MVSLSEPLNYSEITAQLSKDDRIAMTCCNTCVRFCGSTSLAAMYELATKLKADGYNVVGSFPSSCLCVHDYVVDMDFPSDVTAIVVCACAAGESSVYERFKDGVKIVTTVKSLGLVLGDRRVGNLKLMMPFDEYKDLVGHEWQMLSGERQTENKIPVHFGGDEE